MKATIKFISFILLTLLQSSCQRLIVPSQHGTIVNNFTGIPIDRFYWKYSKTCTGEKLGSFNGHASATICGFDNGQAKIDSDGTWKVPGKTFLSGFFSLKAIADGYFTLHLRGVTDTDFVLFGSKKRKRRIDENFSIYSQHQNGKYLELDLYKRILHIELDNKTETLFKNILTEQNIQFDSHMQLRLEYSYTLSDERVLFSRKIFNLENNLRDQDFTFTDYFTLPTGYSDTIKREYKLVYSHPNKRVGGKSYQVLVHYKDNIPVSELGKDIKIVLTDLENQIRFRDQIMMNKNKVLMMDAIRAGDLSEVKVLVKNSTPLDIRLDFNMTPLEFAINYFRYDIAHFLVSQGAPVFCEPDSSHETYLIDLFKEMDMISLKRRHYDLPEEKATKDREKIVELLTQIIIPGNCVNKAGTSYSPLQHSILHNLPNFTKRLLDKGADTNQMTGPPDFCALLTAHRMKDHDAYAQLTESGATLSTETQQLVLKHAVKHLYLNRVKFLFSKGAIVNAEIEKVAKNLDPFLKNSQKMQQVVKDQLFLQK